MGDSLNIWVSNGLEWNREWRIDCTLLYVMPLKFEKPYRAMSVNNSLQIVADDNNNNSSSGQGGGGSKGGNDCSSGEYKYHGGVSAHWHLAPITCARHYYKATATATATIANKS